MTPEVTIIGIGNDFRRDDGVGRKVAERVAQLNLAGVRVLCGISESTAILDAWSGAKRVVVIDAVTGADAAPGRIRRWTAADLQATKVVSSHAIGLAQTCALGRALSRMPDELVVFTVDVVDTNHGLGLTSAVAAAVPDLVERILAELSR